MSREDQSNKRSNSIRIRLSPEILERFETISKDIGMAPATLAAFVVGNFVREQERILPSRSALSVIQSLVMDNE